MNIQNCPQCGEELKKGYVNAPTIGILWLKENIKFAGIFNKKVIKLQKDWWGFPKLSKDNLPALRCKKCKIVIFEYNNEKI